MNFLEIWPGHGVRRKFGPVSSKIVFRSKDSIIVPADELSEPASGREDERESGRASGRAGERAGGRASGRCHAFDGGIFRVGFFGFGSTAIRSTVITGQTEGLKGWLRRDGFRVEGWVVCKS